jgi:proline iminopeptidase
MKLIAIAFIALLLCNCNTKPVNGLLSYHATTDSGLQTGGERMISIETPAGKYKVFTQRIGNNPKIKVLLLHGGPGGCHEFFKCFESFFPKEGIEFYYYDQLGSHYSDKPADTTLWRLPRFVEEVEQVRKALGLDSSNFYLLGHSWGGILGMEYALKYQRNLKGLIISNMMSSCPDYGKYAQAVLAPQFDPKVLDTIRQLEAKGDFSNPKYMGLLMPHFYKKHLCRLEEWPASIDRAFAALNGTVYVQMQGPSEFGIAGNLAAWDAKERLKNITVPTLTIGGMHDTMDPEHMRWMSTQVQNGRSLICPNGSHCSMWDDQQTYFTGLINFIKDVDEGKAIK